MAQKSHQRPAGCERGRHEVEEPFPEHLPPAQIAPAHEVRALQVLQQRMVGREPAGRGLEALSFQPESLSKSVIVPRPPPAARRLDNRLAYLAQGHGVLMPRGKCGTVNLDK